MPKTASISSPTEDQIKPDLTAEKHGDNGPSRDDLLFFAGQFRLGKEKIKLAQTANKKIRQAAKLRGIEVMILDQVIRIADEEDDTEIDRLRTFKQYAQAFDLPIGSQLDLFDIPAGNGRAPAEALMEKAKRDGYERGLLGQNPNEDAFPPMTEEGQAHIARWHDGQKVNHEMFLKLNEEIKAADAAKEAKKQAKADDAGEDTRH